MLTFKILMLRQTIRVDLSTRRVCLRGKLFLLTIFARDKKILEKYHVNDAVRMLKKSKVNSFNVTAHSSVLTHFKKWCFNRAYF